MPTTVVEHHERVAVFEREVGDAVNLAPACVSDRAAFDGEVGRGDGDGSSVYFADTRNDTVGGRVVALPVERLGRRWRGRSQLPYLVETSFVAEVLDAFARRHLSFLMLSLDRFLSFLVLDAPFRLAHTLYLILGSFVRHRLVLKDTGGYENISGGVEEKPSKRPSRLRDPASSQ